ncbi:esterase family protein [Staphylococcus sp. SQ8-PEA]|uniref:Esterase family protein n=1 Tax=Staphylococcus marylandisciuri TaxID=2981529 RepID=A0ABT2QMT7_9STAP|nr:alpha/beta hydrolase family protein [Staphylococcus marylandisciuri]MCU5745306.1 esterase family protein [Staphylococcus marylandisciuri]
MALIYLNYRTKVLGMHQNLTIILPDDASYFDPNQKARPLKTLMLLHGLSSDETTYLRYTSIERYANQYQLAIIMPRADHSGYANMVYGHSYFDYIIEVWNYAHQILPLSLKREDNFIAGHSMGGYGTLRFALKKGSLFGKACPMSAVFDAQQLINIDWHDFSGEAITGENTNITGTDLDLYHLLNEAKRLDKEIPELLIMCGEEDELYLDNQRMIRYLDQLGIKYQFESDTGSHDYAYWDKAIARVIEWCCTDKEA